MTFSKPQLVFIVFAIFALGWTTKTYSTPWHAREIPHLLAWGERLKAMNSVGRDGHFSGDWSAFEERGNCLPNAQLVWLQSNAEKDAVKAIWRCEAIGDAGGKIVGEIAVQVAQQSSEQSTYAVGVDYHPNAPGMGKLAIIPVSWDRF